MTITLDLNPEFEARLNAQAQAKGMTTEAFLKATIANLLNLEPQPYRVGSALVVQSTPLGDLENSVEKMREERLSSLIADYERSI